jgi:uncharacterized protein (TIGR02099 family)
MPTSTRFSGATRVVRHALRSLAYAVAAGAILLCATLLALRFYLYPKIEEFRPRIEALLGGAIGQSVSIGSVAPGWDGWNPRLTLGDVAVRGPGQRTLLSLPKVDAVVSWRWALVGRLRMKSLQIDRPDLLVRRDAEGRLHVAGAVIDLAAAGGDPGIGEWLLDQRAVAVRNATLTWVDELRGAPPLRLERVEFYLENGIGRHRFGLTGSAPESLALPIDVRGDFRVGSLHDRETFAGQLYVLLAYADVGAWREWLPLPLDILSGRGGARVWVEIGRGRVERVTGDFDLSEVALRVARDRSPLAVARLSGRLRMQQAQDGRGEVTLQDVLAETDRGVIAGPGTGTLAFEGEAPRRLTRGTLRTGSLQLAALAALAAEAGLPVEWEQLLARINPSGLVEDASFVWEGALASPASYQARGRFRGLSTVASEGLPGIEAATGTVEATEKGGSVQIAGRAVRLDLPGLFEQPLQADTLDASASWQVRRDEWGVRVQKLAIANDHAAATLAGEYRREKSGPGSVDLSGALSRGDVRHLWRYLPLRVDAQLRTWLRYALVAGTVEEGRFRLKGNLADFPFAAGNGEFEIVAKGQGGILDYADGWPRVSGIRAEVILDRASIRVVGREAQILGARVTRAEAGIASLLEEHPRLRIQGEASGPAQEFLRFVAESPVSGWINRFTEAAEATGDARLALRLELPLGALETSKVSGEVTVAGSTVSLGAGYPVLEDARGTLAFTEQGIRANNVAATIHGSAAVLDFASSESGVAISARGKAIDLARLAGIYQVPGATLLQGRSDWEIAIDAGKGVQGWDLTLPLAGATVNLPPPLAKSAGTVVPLRIVRRPTAGDRERVTLTYGAPERPIARLALLRRHAGGEDRIESGLLTLGRATGEPDRPGIWVRADVDELDLEPWLALRKSIAPGAQGTATAPAAQPGFEPAGVDLRARRLALAGKVLHDASVVGTLGERWSFEVRSPALAGVFDWRPAKDEAGRGHLKARLARLELPLDAAEPAPAGAVPAKTAPAGQPRDWPHVDLAVERLVFRGHELGRFSVLAEPRGADWRIDRLQLVNPDGELTGDGWWRAAPAARTDLGLTLDVEDAGAYLRRFGYVDAVIGAPTALKGELTWAGGPAAFESAQLNGSFSLKTGSGQFAKVDPGIAKLLGVLNLQSLPRRITLDFRDVFSEGFVFDELTGTFRVASGVITTDDLRFAGPGARVEIRGEANVPLETQNLQIRVFPSLSTSIALGAAIGLANPAIGAAILLGQKILQDPMEKIFAADYQVTGGWADPQVKKVAILPGVVGGSTAPRP